MRLPRVAGGSQQRAAEPACEHRDEVKVDVSYGFAASRISRRNTLVVVRRVVRRSAVLAVVIIHLLYVKPLYRQWFKDSFALWDRHHFTVLLVLLLL